MYKNGTAVSVCTMSLLFCGFLRWVVFN